MSSLDYSTAGILAHLMYFGLASLAVIVFVAVYVMVTPHHEFRLIRQGNTAAAISLGGAILGYTLPLAKAVAQSEALWDMALWAGVALVAQLIAYGITRIALPQLSDDVKGAKTAPAILLASIALGVGLLNAAAMTE